MRFLTIQVCDYIHDKITNLAVDKSCKRNKSALMETVKFHKTWGYQNAN